MRVIASIRVSILACLFSRRPSGRIGMYRRMLDQASTIRGHSRVFAAVCALVVIFVFLPFAQVGAVPVPVNNPSFESPAVAEEDFGAADGWVIAPGPGFAGVFNPTVVQVPAVPDGTQVAFAGIGGSLTQTLSSVLTANTLYTLQVDVGRRLDGSNAFIDHSVRLLAGTTVVAEGSVSALAPGQFKTLTLTFLTGAAHPELGSALGIQLVSPVPEGSQVLFDNVKLEENEDECPNSVLSPTVVIDGCNSGVPNPLFPSGCTISDLIAECAEGAGNHGQFVSCVSHVTNGLKKAGTITGQQKGAIQSCAAQANIP